MWCTAMWCGRSVTMWVIWSDAMCWKVINVLEGDGMWCDQSGRTRKKRKALRCSHRWAFGVSIEDCPFQLRAHDQWFGETIEKPLNWYTLVVTRQTPNKSIRRQSGQNKTQNGCVQTVTGMNGWRYRIISSHSQSAFESPNIQSWPLFTVDIRRDHSLRVTANRKHLERSNALSVRSPGQVRLVPKQIYFVCRADSVQTTLFSLPAPIKPTNRVVWA